MPTKPTFEGKLGISEGKLKHIYEVAMLSYKIAKEKYYLKEWAARRAFMLGWCHDIGYVFADKAPEHEELSYMLCLETFYYGPEEILTHSNPLTEHSSVYDKILHEADMRINSDGEEVSIQERIEEVERRYGTESEKVTNMKNSAKFLGLI